MDTELFEIQVSDLDFLEAFKIPAYFGRSTETPYHGRPNEAPPTTQYPIPQEKLISCFTDDPLPTAVYRSDTELLKFFENPNTHEQRTEVVFFPNLGALSSRETLARIQPTGRMQTYDSALAYLWDIAAEIAGEKIDLRKKIKKGDVLILKQKSGFLERYFIQQTEPIGSIFMVYLQEVTR